MSEQDLNLVAEIEFKPQGYLVVQLAMLKRIRSFLSLLAPKIALLCLVQFLTLATFAESSNPSAENNQKLLRRLVVFPIKVDTPLGEPLNNAWWKVREELVKNRRFLIASRDFMIKKDVFQGRGQLSNVDCIILGRLLDAQALVVTFLEQRNFNMIVYDGRDGQILWRQMVVLHNSLPIADQLESSSLKLIRDFIAAIPYQAFLTIDPLIGTPVYLKEDQKFAKIYIGLNTQVQLGDKVEWVVLDRVQMLPLFQGGGQLTVQAEGTLVEIGEEIVTARIDRINDQWTLQDETLVRIPGELRRLQELFSIEQIEARRAPTKLITSELTDAASPTESEHKHLVTSLTFLANLAAFLLLAF